MTGGGFGGTDGAGFANLNFVVAVSAASISGTDVDWRRLASLRWASNARPDSPRAVRLRPHRRIFLNQQLGRWSADRALVPLSQCGARPVRRPKVRRPSSDSFSGEFAPVVRHLRHWRFMPWKLWLVVLVCSPFAFPQTQPSPARDFSYNVEWRLITAGKARLEWNPRPSQDRDGE